jgi:hypothetical protein
VMRWLPWPVALALGMILGAMHAGFWPVAVATVFLGFWGPPWRFVLADEWLPKTRLGRYLRRRQMRPRK